ncbi:MAG: Lrp/AsnC ligand binding domain-containing protein [Candidatus Hydrothermarchaeales archaeon]
MPKEFKMMGLVNIKTEVGMFDDVVAKLKTVEEVKGIYGAYGEVDIITLVETSEGYLSDVVLKKIRTIEGVTDTNTTVLIPLS